MDSTNQNADYKILLVDGSPDNRAQLRRMLLLGSNHRYQFREADTGSACLNACLNSVDNRPDCVILDQHLPDYELTQLLRELGGHDSPCCPILIVIGSSGQLDGKTLLSQGAQDFISKNWMNPESLTRSIENSIERFWLNQELKSSHRRFKAFLENSALIAWMKDEEGKYSYLSENFEKRFNVQFDDWIGKTDFDLWPEWMAKKFRNNDLKVLSSNDSLEMVEEAFNPDGSLSWWLTSKFPFKDQVGRRFIGGLAVDITERKQTELALRDSEAFNFSILEHSADCIKVIDLEGNLILMNGPGRCAMEIDDFGSYINKPWISLWPDEDKYLKEEALQTARLGGIGRFQGFCPTAKGKPKWWDVVITPVLDSVGKPKRFISISRDITETKKTELALRESEGRWRYALGISQMGAWELNLEDNTAWRSLRHDQIFGYSELLPEWNYQIFLKHVLKEDREVVNQCFLKAKTKHLDWNYECRIRRTDGVIRWIWAYGKPFAYDGKHLIRMFGLILDITDRKQAENALKDADRQKDEFLAMLAHELRNPLTPISNTAQILSLRPIDESTLTRSSELLNRNVAQLTHLVDDLLDVSRITRGLVKITKQPIELVKLLKETAESVQIFLHSKQQIFHFDSPPQPIYLNGDPVRLTQVFSNLIINATKFTGEGGLIDLIVNVEGPSVVVRIRDNGMGIEPQLLPHVFDLFIQGERRLDRLEGGLGLGLTLVKTLVRLHDGQVTAFSQGANQGSDFVVTLPTIVERAVLDEPTHTKSLSKVTEQGLRILMIDDNVDILNAMSILLEMSGHQVASAINGAKGIAEAQRFVPDLVILDIGLPGMDGYQVARKLREQPFASKMLIIALSGYAPPKSSQDIHEAGFDHYFIKPLNFNKLQSLIAEYQHSSKVRNNLVGLLSPY